MRDGLSDDVAGPSPIQGIITFTNVKNTEVSGFEIKDFGEPYVGVYLKNSNSNSVHDFKIDQVFNKFDDFFETRDAIFIEQSSNNTIIDNDISGEYVSIFIKIGSSNYIGMNKISSFPTGIGGFEAALLFELGYNNVFENNILTGSGIFIGGTDACFGTQIKANTVSEASFGIEIACNGSNVSDNKVNNSEVGIDVSGNDNSIKNNNLTGNATCYQESPMASGNVFSGNICN